MASIVRKRYNPALLTAMAVALGWLHACAVHGQHQQVAKQQRPAAGAAAKGPGARGQGQVIGPPVARTTPDRSLSLPNWCSAGPYARNGESLFTSMTRSEPSHKVYHNAYWHAHKWYALVPPDVMLRRGDASASPDSNSNTANADGTASSSTTASSNDSSAIGGAPLEEGLSVNSALINLPVADIGAFTDNMRAGFLPGTTLLVDFPFPAYPDNLGHWAEIMLTTYSVLAGSAWRNNTVGSRARFVDRILLPNLRKEMNEWFKEILGIAVSPGVRKGGAPVPPIIDHADLEAFPKLSWLAIENLLVVQDRYTHPERKTGFIGADHGDLWRYDGCARYVNPDMDIGFSDPSFAASFRAAAYRRAGLALPAGSWEPGSPPPPPVPGQPRVMTLLVAHEDYPPVANWEEVQATLRRVGSGAGLEVRTVTLSTDAPFASHLDTFARSSVLVARHGPLLATAALMPPGSAVFELLPYKWEWLGMSKLYFNMTQSTRDLHHFAWRPTDHRLAHYDHDNYTRYHPWTPEECSARECLMVHARAGLTVDLTELESLLVAKLPGVVSGKGVEELREPWPKAV